MKKFLCVFLFAVSLKAQGQSAILQCFSVCPCYSYGPNYLINGIQQDSGNCVLGQKKIQIAIIDSCSFIPWNVDSCIHYFNEVIYYSCVNNTFPCNAGHGVTAFEFHCNDSIQMNGLVALLNAVPQGNHILAYSLVYYTPLSTCLWPMSVRNAFMQLGSSMMSTQADTLPFIFYVKKGFPSTLHEVSGTLASDTISLTVTIECMPASVDESVLESSQVTLFPNPATDELRIQNLPANENGLAHWQAGAELKIESIEIYNVLGKILFSQNPEASSQELTIDVSSLPPGIYFIRIKTSGESIIKKFVKQ